MCRLGSIGAINIVDNCQNESKTIFNIKTINIIYRLIDDSDGPSTI